VTTKKVVKPLKEMTKAELMVRARDFESMYNAARETAEKTRWAASQAAEELRLAGVSLEAYRRESLTHEFMNLELRQTSKALYEVNKGLRGSLLLREREVRRMTSALVALRPLLKRPVSICPQCATVEYSDLNSDVLCDACMKSLSGLKTSQQQCGIVVDVED